MGVESMTRVVALYKTFDGEEFVRQSVESIYHKVTKIVMVHSRKAWDNSTEGNRVAPVMKEWIEKYDTDKKIIELWTDETNQEAQYKLGFLHIKTHLLCDWIMLIDSDEVWDDENWARAQFHLEKNFHADALHCKMHTYIKEKHYRVHPPEQACPTVFIRKSIREMVGVRGNKIKPKICMDGVFFHHFTLVRDNEDDIRRKIKTSNEQDGELAVDVDWWMDNVWANIPKVKDFHITKGYESSWHSLMTIGREQLPATMRYG